MTDHTSTYGAAGPYLDLTKAIAPKKPRQKNLTRDQWVTRAYNAEMRVRQLETELKRTSRLPGCAVPIVTALGWIVGFAFGYLCFSPK